MSTSRRRALPLLILLWFMAFLLCFGWSWWNIQIALTPTWLDALFGVSLIILLAYLSQSMIPPARLRWPIQMIAWVWLAWMLLAGIRWAAKLLQRSGETGGLAKEILYWPVQVFGAANSLIAKLHGSRPISMSLFIEKGGSLLLFLGLLAAGALLAAIMLVVAWKPLQALLGEIIDELETRLPSTAFRPGRWLAWLQRLLILLTASFLLVFGMGSLANTHRTPVVQPGLIRGPNAAPQIYALLVSDDGTLFAGTSDGIYRSEDTGDSWQPASTGLMNPGVGALASDSGRGSLWAGALWSGIYRSSDAGVTWEQQTTDSGLSNVTISTIIFDARRDTLYVGTSAGVYRSEDAGASWQLTNAGLKDLNIEALALDANRDILYAGTLGGVYRSEDAGASWQRASEGLTNDDVRALNFDISRDLLYAATGGGIYRSEDAGASWQRASEGLTNDNVRALTLDADHSILYAGTLGGVFRSGNAGASWEPANYGLTNTNVHTLALDIDHGTLYAGTANGVYRSHNDGASWQFASAGLTAIAIRALAYDSSRDALYAGTQVGVFLSDTGGNSWQPASVGLDSTYVNALILNADRGVLYAGTRGGVFCSDDGGATWQAANRGLANTSVEALVYDINHGTLYAGLLSFALSTGSNGDLQLTYHGGVYRSEDGGTSWQSASTGIANAGVLSLIYDSSQNILYAGTTGGVYRSNDNGLSWHLVNSGLAEVYVQTLVFDSERGTLYAGTDNSIYRSENGGTSWQLTSAGLTSTSIHALALGTDRGSLYAGTEGGGVYRSDDYGATWQLTSAGLTNTDIQALVLDAGSNTIYVGTWGGVYRSRDGGASWQPANVGLTNTTVQALASDAGRGFLYVGTEIGVYRSDNAGVTWQPASAGLENLNIQALALDVGPGILYARTEYGTYGSTDSGSTWKLVSGRVLLGDLVMHLRPQPDSFAFLSNTSSQTPLLAPSGGGLLALWLRQHLTVQPASLWPQTDGSALLFVGWGNTISRAVLPRDYPRTSLTWAFIRMTSHIVTRWLAANRTLVAGGFLGALAMTIFYLITTFVFALGIPFPTAVLARRHLELYADPVKLALAWPKWEAHVRHELLRHGDVAPADLRHVPGRLRSYAIQYYAAMNAETQTLDLRGDNLRLMIGDRLQRWKLGWRITSQTMGEQAAGLTTPARLAVDELAAALADALGLTLGPARDFEAVRAYQVEAPALRLKLPQRFPLVFLADPRPGPTSVQLLVDTVEVMKETEYFALVVPLEPSPPQFDIPARLRETVAQSPRAHDFVVLSKDELEELLIARHPILTLARYISTQVDLTMVSPFVIRGPVQENMFFGREYETRTLVERAPTHDFAVVGNRKIGKTSLLQRTRARFADGKRARVLDIDCQTVSNAAGFLEALQVNPSVKLTQSTPSGFMEEMQHLRQAGPPVVLLLDEVDALLADEAAHGEPLVSAWRSLAQNDVCHFVFCGASGLARRLRDPRSAFFNFAEPLPLRYLSPEEARLVIKQPMESLGIALEDQAAVLEAMLALTSGHPNLVQYVGRELVKAANERQERRVFATDVNAISASPEFVKYFLDTIWGEAGPLERLVMLLAPDESFQIGQIEDALAAAGITVSSEALDDALDMLDIYSILRQENQTFHLVPRAFHTILHSTQDVQRRIEQETRRLTGAIT